MKLYNTYIELLIENFKTQRERFIQQGHDPEVVDKYLKDFDIFRNAKYKEANDAIQGLSVPAGISRFDVDSYKTFEELKAIIDYVSSYRDFGHRNFEEIKVDGKPIFKNDDVEIYYADTPRACITYKGDKPYTWCVARNDAQNLFYQYRLGSSEPTFYFVKLLKRIEKEFEHWKNFNFAEKYEFIDKWHFFVLQITKDGKYIVTSAQNKMDEKMTWEDILKFAPELKELKHVFVHKPLTDSDYNKSDITDEKFSSFSYREKLNYIDNNVFSTKRLTDNQFLLLPLDLKYKYINKNIILTYGQYNAMKDDKKFLKRYRDLLLRKIGDLDIINYDDKRLLSYANEGLKSLESLGVDVTYYLKVENNYLDFYSVRDDDFDEDDGYYPQNVRFNLIQYRLLKDEILDFIENGNVQVSFEDKLLLKSMSNENIEDVINQTIEEIVEKAKNGIAFMESEDFKFLFELKDKKDLIIDKFINFGLLDYVSKNSEYRLYYTSQLIYKFLFYSSNKDDTFEKIKKYIIPEMSYKESLNFSSHLEYYFKIIKDKESFIDYIVNNGNFNYTPKLYSILLQNTNNPEKIKTLFLDDIKENPDREDKSRIFYNMLNYSLDDSFIKNFLSINNNYKNIYYFLEIVEVAAKKNKDVEKYINYFFKNIPQYTFFSSQPLFPNVDKINKFIRIYKDFKYTISNKKTVIINDKDLLNKFIDNIPQLDYSIFKLIDFLYEDSYFPGGNNKKIFDTITRILNKGVSNIPISYETKFSDVLFKFLDFPRKYQYTSEEIFYLITHTLDFFLENYADKLKDLVYKLHFVINFLDESDVSIMNLIINKILEKDIKIDKNFEGFLDVLVRKNYFFKIKNLESFIKVFIKNNPEIIDYTLIETILNSDDIFLNKSDFVDLLLKNNVDKKSINYGLRRAYQNKDVTYIPNELKQRLFLQEQIDRIKSMIILK